MKVFHKLYIGIVSIIAISLIVFGYFIIFADFNKRIRDEIDAGTKRHVLLVDSLIKESRRVKDSGEEYDYYLVAAWNMRTNNPFPFNLYNRDKKIIHKGINATINVDLEETEHTLYKEVNEGGRTYIVFISGTGIFFNDYYIVTASDVTNIYEDSASWDYPSQKKSLDEQGIPNACFAKMLYPATDNEDLAGKIAEFIKG